MNSFYFYRVHWWGEGDSIQVNEGFLVAKNYSEAANLLETKMFDFIDRIDLISVNDSEILDLGDIHDVLNREYNTSSSLGPQIIEALQEYIEDKE